MNQPVKQLLVLGIVRKVLLYRWMLDKAVSYCIVSENEMDIRVAEPDRQSRNDKPCNETSVYILFLGKVLAK